MRISSKSAPQMTKSGRESRGLELNTGPLQGHSLGVGPARLSYVRYALACRVVVSQPFDET